MALLSGCGEVKLDQQTANELANPALTAQPTDVIVYPDDRPSIPDGHQTFQQNCAQCHTGVASTANGTRSGAGDTAMIAASPEGMPSANAAEPVKQSNFKFDQRWANATKPIDIYKVVANGKNGHPRFSNKLSTREIWNSVAYARAIGQPALTGKELEAIDPVFGSNCAVCHGTKGDGDGPLMRNLEPMPANFQKFDRFFNRTDDVLYDHIANGIRWEGMPNFLGKKDAKKNISFDEAYIKKLAQYVRRYTINHEPVMSVASTGGSVNPAVGADAPQPGGGAPTQPETTSPNPKPQPTTGTSR